MFSGFSRLVPGVAAMFFFFVFYGLGTAAEPAAEGCGHGLTSDANVCADGCARHGGGELYSGALSQIQARLCSNCGFGNKRDNCVRCGKWVGSSGIPAQICKNCGFGSKKDYCAKCGKWMGSTSYPAQLCGTCGFGNKRYECVQCGRSVNTLSNPFGGADLSGESVKKGLDEDAMEVFGISTDF